MHWNYKIEARLAVVVVVIIFYTMLCCPWVRYNFRNSSLAPIAQRIYIQKRCAFVEPYPLCVCAICCSALRMRNCCNFLSKPNTKHILLIVCLFFVFDSLLSSFGSTLLILSLLDRTPFFSCIVAQNANQCREFFNMPFWSALHFHIIAN